MNHGQSMRGKITPEYAAWKSMKSRCKNNKSVNYHNYGGRGIAVCKRWSKFENFYADMGRRPAGKSLDRINNDGNYGPHNCRWATPKEQSRNSRHANRITFRGKTMCLSDWAAQVGIVPNSLRVRLRRGWNLAETLTTPKGMK